MQPLFDRAEAYDSLDPNGNITIKWDIINWTPDGYVVAPLHINSSAFHLNLPLPNNCLP
jgi:hypothetical protein